MTTDDRLLNCTSSESPNKSSGDIGELKPCPFCGSKPILQEATWAGGTTISCPQENCISVEAMAADDARAAHIWNTRTPDPESAAEIERLRREVGEANTTIAQLDQRCALFERSTITAESAVAAAWEEAADWHDQQSELAMNSLHCGDNTSTIAAFRRSANWHTECAEHFRSRASAIRAAVSKKTAESGHSPSTHNSESE